MLRGRQAGEGGQTLSNKLRRKLIKAVTYAADLCREDGDAASLFHITANRARWNHTLVAIIRGEDACKYLRTRLIENKLVTENAGITVSRPSREIQDNLVKAIEGLLSTGINGDIVNDRRPVVTADPFSQDSLEKYEASVRAVEFARQAIEATKVKGKPNADKN